MHQKKYRYPHAWLHSMAYKGGRYSTVFLMCTSASVVILWNRATWRTSLSARYCMLFQGAGLLNEGASGPQRRSIISWSAQVTAVPTHPHSILSYVSACGTCAYSHTCAHVGYKNWQVGLEMYQLLMLYTLLLKCRLKLREKCKINIEVPQTLHQW